MRKRFLHFCDSGSSYCEVTPWIGKPFLLAIGLLAVAVLGCARFAAAVDVPVVKGDLGTCSADFTVLDSNGKPVYDAKVHVTILYGFMNKRKSELEIGTNSDGKARIEGLPNRFGDSSLLNVVLDV